MSLLLALILAQATPSVQAGPPSQAAPSLLAVPPAQAPVSTVAPHGERAGVELPIKAYFRYHQTGDPKGLAEAFHPDALLQWADEEGARKVLSQAEWQKSATEKLAKAKEGRRPEVRCEIAWLEIIGNAATAKILLDYPTFRFIDFMHLVRLKEGWKIVDKIYHREEGSHVSVR